MSKTTADRRIQSPQQSPVAAAPVPVGTIISWVGSDPSLINSQGWVACDGSWISESGDGFALASVIGSAFGHCQDPGSGQTFVRLPDLRGMFLRGLATTATQDPDGATRSATPFQPPAQFPNAAPTGPANSGFEVGSVQADCFASHAHGSTAGWAFFVDDADSDSCIATNADESFPGYGGSGLPSATGGNETRPKNIYVLYMIYAGNPLQVYPVGGSTA